MIIFNNSINMLTIEEIIKIYIDEFNASKERGLMLKGEAYYKVENDILNRKMTRFEHEQPVEDETKTNNKLAHGFMHTQVDDKVNYLVTKPYTLECKDEKYLDAVKKVLGKRFQKKLNQLGTETSNKGIAWLHAYIDAAGQFKVMRIQSEQCIPLWIDNDHEELQALIRYYDLEFYEGKDKKTITKIEYWTPENVKYYVMQDEVLSSLDGTKGIRNSGKVVILDSEMYLDDENDYDGHFKVNNEPLAWGRVPFIPFKNNDFELPDLQFVKTLVDNYDLTRSDVANLLEDIKNIIYALRGYGGENLSEFMRDLAYYRAVKLEEDGGVDKVETTIDIEAAREHYETLKKDIYDFGQAVDKTSDKLGNSPSGIALKFIYSGLDLKCNAMEDNFKWAFEQLLYFVDMYLTLTKQTVSDKEIKIVFNRDIAINESQAITDCQNSQGVISNKTIIANHPWVEDVDDEMKQIKEEGKSEEPDLFDDSNKGGSEE